MRNFLIFLGLSFLAISVVFPGPARADIHFYSLVRNGNADNDLYSHAQEQSEWCWAAVVQMAYGLQGIEIEQSQVVALIAGRPVNVPAHSEDVWRALTQIGHDRHGQLFTSVAMVLRRNGSGQLVYVTPTKQLPMTPVMMAFLFGYGIPTIVLYTPPGSQSGHFVLITGVSIDTSSAKAVHYQVEDPWPLDTNGNLISPGRAVRKQLAAQPFEQSMLAMVVPIVTSEQNVAVNQKFANLQGKSFEHFTFADLDKLSGASMDKQTFADEQKLRSSFAIEGSQIAASTATSSTANNGSGFRGGLLQIVSAAPQFQSIKGGHTGGDAKTDDYRCTVSLPDFRPGRVTTYKDQSLPVVVFSTSRLSKDAAKSRFASVRSQVRSALGGGWTPDDLGASAGFTNRFSMTRQGVEVEVLWTSVMNSIALSVGPP